MSVLLSAQGLHKRFGGVYALRDVGFVQHNNETLGMIGPNGSGKTTFINAATGQIRLDRGTIRFLDRNIVGFKSHRICAVGLVRTYQAVRTFSELSVRENFATAALSADKGGEEPRSKDALREILEWLRLDMLVDHRAGGLTLFDQRKLELGMRLVLNPRLILLDEPVGGLAPPEIREMMLVLQQLKARCTLFVIEHTMKVIRELADRVVVLVAGTKIADGAPVDVLKDRKVVEQYLGATNA